MRILSLNKKDNFAVIVPEIIGDLWHLQHIIEPGDIVESKSTRTFKLGKKEEKKPVFIKLKVEKVEFSKHSNTLRISGIIIDGSPEEYVQKGRHHTIILELGNKFKIVKEFKSHHLARLKEAEAEAKKPILNLLLMDEEKALFATVRNYGVEYGSEFYSGSNKREEHSEDAVLKYYSELAKEISSKEGMWIVAGPGFEKENFKKYLEKKYPNLLKRIVFDSVSYVERSGVQELFKRGTIAKVLGKNRLEEEIKLIDSFLLHLNKDDGYALYGLKEIKDALSIGAVDTLLVLDELLRTNKEIVDVVELAEKTSKITIFSSESEAGALLKGFGGLCALLRFRIK